ncbi:type II toxin-antitoxin system Phd/YefM family antitoxin [Fluoribacter gormanii]|uniref:type II toxin-antitoxin system Phd/YefM family antitoxin n=1 Tax=Fluoribacter gormanii TaxID=464 RepID=UPI001040F446|nr:type II toxin-antitoxin system prevent-host-death family antitoxin [Fluoribacter gormanii]
MHQVNIHEAKTHLSRLIDEAVHGKSFIIAKSGRPLVKVVSVAYQKNQRLGFMEKSKIPDDFDSMGKNEIEHMFGNL